MDAIFLKLDDIEGESQAKGFEKQLEIMSYSHNVGIAGGRNYVDTIPGTPCDPADMNTHGSCSQATEYPDSFPDGSTPGGGFTTIADALNIGFFAQDRYTIKRYLTLVSGFRFDIGILRDYQGNRLGSLIGYGPRLSIVYDLLHDRSTLLSCISAMPPARAKNWMPSEFTELNVRTQLSHLLCQRKLDIHN